MRVSFLGKGGSGKTTAATMFIKYLDKINKPVLAIDADINVHLGKALGMETLYMGDDFDYLANYLEEAKIIDNKFIIGSTIPTYDSKFITEDLNDRFFNQFATKKNNITLLTVGTYQPGNVGSECYHSKLGNIVLVFNRLLDNKNLMVVTDSTAGVDSVGTSMFAVSDINVFVVEPTKKSVDVFKDFVKMTEKYSIPTYVIANKIMDEDDLDFINNNIEEKYILGYINNSKEIKKYDQGNVEELDKFVNNNEELNKKLYDLLMNMNKDWEKYYNLQKEIYIGDANEWYSKYYGVDLTSYIDKYFDYKKVIEKYGIKTEDK